MARSTWALLSLTTSAVAITFTASSFLFLTGSATSEISSNKERVPELTKQMSITPKILGEGINSAAFSPDGNHIAIGSLYSRNIVIWDVKNNSEYLQISTQGSSLNANSISWSPDGRFITDGRPKRPENILRLWNPKSGAVVREFPFAAQGRTEPARFSRDSTKMLLSMLPPKSGDPDVALFDLENGSRTDLVSGLSLQALAWAGDKVVAVGGWSTAHRGKDLEELVRVGGEKIVRVIDLADRDKSKSITLEGGSSNFNPGFTDLGFSGIYEIAVDSNGKQLIVGRIGQRNEFYLDLINLDPLQLHSTIPLGKQKPNALFFFPDDQKFGVVHFGSKGKIFSSASGQLVSLIPSLTSIGGAVVSADSKRLAIGAAIELAIYRID